MTSRGSTKAVRPPITANNNFQDVNCIYVGRAFWSNAVHFRCNNDCFGGRIAAIAAVAIFHDHAVSMSIPSL